MSTANGAGDAPAALHASVNGSTERASSTIEADIPSPSIFANIAAAVGEQDPLTHAGPLVGAGATPKPGVQSAASASDMAMVAMHAMDPYSALMYNTEHFVNAQLKQLLEASTRFFSLYRHSYSGQKLAEEEGVAQAHRALLAVIDQLLLTASQAGFGGLPCPGQATGQKRKQDPATERHTPAPPTTKDDAVTLTTDMLRLSNDTFERRERIRESASMVTSILMTP